MSIEAIDTPPDDGMTIESGEVDERAADAPLAEFLPPSKLPKDRQFTILSGWWKADADFSRAWRAQAREWFDFRAGEQWSAEDKALLDDQERPHIVFNRVLTILKAVAGMEINGRHEIHFIPRNTEDTAVNEVLSAASKWMADSCDGEDEESTAFDHCCTTGMGWCLDGDTAVRLPKTHFATTRLYSGDIVEVDLENGKKLTGTPNHPILTDMGWKALGAINEGDRLINGAFLERVAGFPIHDFDHVESRFEDKIDAFRAGREVLRLGTAAQDFYGDGTGSKVHTVYADRLLLDKIRDAAAAKSLEQMFFRGRHLLAKMGIPLFGEGLVDAAFCTTVGQASFYAGHIPSANRTRHHFVAKLESCVSEYLRDHKSVNAKPLPDLLAAKFFGEVETDGLVHKFFRAAAGFLGGAESVAATLKVPFDSSLANAEFVSDFFDWKPLIEVEARKLGNSDAKFGEFVVLAVGVNRRTVSQHPVHDVGTSVGVFLAADVITSNCENRMSYKADPSGLYVEECINPLEMYWQRGIRKKNLVGPDGGARRLSRVRQMPVGDAMRMFPGFTRDQLDAVWAVDGPMDYPQKTLEQKWKRDTDNVLNLPYDDQCEVTIVQMQWIEEDVYWIVADMAKNTKIELTDKEYNTFGSRMKQLAELATASGADASQFEVHSARMTRDVYKQAFLGGDGVMLRPAGPSPIAGQFSWQCITGELDFVKGTWFGLVKVMRDPQMWANKWLSQILHILNTTAKGGIIAETDAFDDQREAEEGYALPDNITWAAEGALSGANPKIIPKPGAGVADGYLGLMTFAISSIKDVTGINLELLGQQDQNQPGIIEAMRKQAGMTVLATLFDSLRRFRKNTGRSRLYFIQNFLSDGRLVRVVGPDGASAVRLAKEKTTGEYDVIVDDTPTSPNQKEANWAIIMPLMGLFKEQLMAHPEVLAMLLEYSPLPSRVVEAIKGFIKQGQDDPKAQQEAAENRALLVDTATAKIARDKAAAIKDQTTAQLNMAKVPATQATAEFDMAMARNMLEDNMRQGQFEELKHHISIMETRSKAIAAAARAERDRSGAQVDQMDAGTRRIKALADHTNAGAERDRVGVGALIEHLVGTSTVRRNDAAAVKDLAIADKTRREPVRPAAGA